MGISRSIPSLIEMSISQLKETSSRWNFLSKVDLLGALDFWTLTISLDSLRPEEAAGLTAADIPANGSPVIKFQEYERKRKVLTLAAHEYTHFVDATSTLWGLKHLSAINACDALSMVDEEQFHVLKRSHDYMRSIRLPDYYTTIDQGLSADRPWRSAVSSGVLFSSDGRVTDRTVIFVNFFTADEKRLVRSPLSMVSLLEASAMAKEIEVRFALLHQLSEAERTVELKQMHDEIFSYLYNSKITEYSACFHLIANLQNEKDIGTTSRGVGILCRTVLNAPEISFDTAAKNIKVYANFINLPIDSLEVQRLKKALEQRNRGALFFLLAVLLPKNVLKGERMFNLGVENALKAVGLSFEKLRRGAFDEAQRLHDELSKANLSSIRLLAKCGYENFQKIFPSGMAYRFGDLSLPPAVFGDADMTKYTFNAGDQNQLARFDLDTAYDELIKCQFLTENFAKACI